MGKIVFVFIATLIGVGVLLGVYLAGWTAGVHRGYNKRLADVGLNRRTAQLFTRAVHILGRLGGYVDSERFSDDYLSPATKEQVTGWVADYRSEVNRT